MVDIIRDGCRHDLNTPKKGHGKRHVQEYTFRSEHNLQNSKVGDDKIQLCNHSMSVAVDTSQFCCHKLTHLFKKFYRQIQHNQLTSMIQSVQVIF